MKSSQVHPMGVHHFFPSAPPQHFCVRLALQFVVSYLTVPLDSDLQEGKDCVLFISISAAVLHTQQMLNKFLFIKLSYRGHKSQEKEVICKGEVMLLPSLGTSRIQCEFAEVLLPSVILSNMQIGMRTDTVNSQSFSLLPNKSFECHTNRCSTCVALSDYLERNVPAKSNIQGQLWKLA